MPLRPRRRIASVAFLSRGEPSEADARVEAERRRKAELRYQRLISVFGLIGIGAALGAIMGALDVSGWVIGLVVAMATVILAAVLWTVRL